MKKYIFLAFLVVIGAGGYYLFNNLDVIVRKLVNKYGSQVTGTEVDLQGFSINLANGEGKIGKFTVANPKGYTAPYLFSTDGVFVKVDIKSLTSDTIVIEEIRVEKPSMTYEMVSLTQNNIAQIMDNVKKNTQKAEAQEAKPQTPAKEEAKSSEGGKKVVINKISINGINLEAAIQTPAIPGVSEAKTISQSIVLPNIVIKDIGKDKGGESVIATISKIMTRVLDEASKAVVKNGVGNLNKQLDGVKATAEEKLNKTIDSVKEKVNTQGIFNKLGM